jgi:hypothetical protein
LPLVAVPLIVFTVAVLGVDAIKTDSWTLTAQNLGALRGDQGCGLADDLVAPAAGSIRALPLRRKADAPSVPAWVPAAPLGNLSRFALGPIDSGVARTPWFASSDNQPIGLFATGQFGPRTNLALDFGRVDRGRVSVVRREGLPAWTATPDAQVATWRFFSAQSIPGRADAVRVVLRGEGAIGQTLAVTAPVGYGSQTLARTLERPGTSSLTNPYILSYFPCANEPILRGGVVDVPNVLLSFSSDPGAILGRVGGTFNGLLDLYPLTRLPLVDPSMPPSRSGGASPGLPTQLALYEVDTRIPGAGIAPAVATSG